MKFGERQFFFLLSDTLRAESMKSELQAFIFIFHIQRIFVFFFYYYVCKREGEFSSILCRIFFYFSSIFFLFASIFFQMFPHLLTLSKRWIIARCQILSSRPWKRLNTSFCIVSQYLTRMTSPKLFVYFWRFLFFLLLFMYLFLYTLKYPLKIVTFRHLKITFN